MGFPTTNAAQQIGTPQAAPTASTTHSQTTEAVERSSDLIVRLYNVRNRLSGEPSDKVTGEPNIPVGVLPMAITVLGNIYTAHKMIEEIEQLLG